MWQKVAKSTEESSTPGKAPALTTAGEGSHLGLHRRSLLRMAISSVGSKLWAQGAEGMPQLPGMPSQMPHPQLVWKVGQEIKHRLSMAER